MQSFARTRDDWLRHPVGARLLRAEQQRLAQVLPNLFGYYLVQAGGWGAHTNLCTDSRIRHRFILDDVPEGADLVADAERWPLASDSVDVVVLPHSLELVVNPHRVLRETERVLIAEGHAIIIGFNPWSAWGMWRWAARRRGVPWAGRFLSEGTVRDWLALLGFDTLALYHHGYGLPVRAEWQDRVLERLGASRMPVFPAGGYTLVARKRVVPATPIRPRWSPTARLAGTVGA